MNFSMVLNGVPSDVSFKSFKNWTSGSLKNLIDHNVPLAMSIIQLFTVIDFPYFNIWEKMKHDNSRYLRKARVEKKKQWSRNVLNCHSHGVFMSVYGTAFGWEKRNRQKHLPSGLGILGICLQLPRILRIQKAIKHADEENACTKVKEEVFTDTP
jgi:hypothetical protein